MRCLDGVARLRKEDGASTAYEELLRRVESEAPGSRRFNREELRIRAAGAHYKSNRLPLAELRLRQANLKSRDVSLRDLWTAARLWQDLHRPAEMLGCLRILELRGQRPHLIAAEEHERGRRPVEQMRALNRALDEGYDPWPLWMVRHRWDRVDIQYLKSRLLESVGPNYFIERLLELKRPELGEKEARLAQRHSARIEKGDSRERQEAIDALQTMGVGAAHILAGHLESGDKDVRDRVRRILTDWAEPR